MPLDLSPTQRAALRSGRVEACFLLDLFVDTTPLHCSTLYIPLTYDLGDGDAIYEPMGDRWQPGDGPLSMGSDLTPEPLTLVFDASRAGDDSDFVGRFVDSQWHQRRVRMTLLTFVVGTNMATPIAPIISWEGSMDYREFPEVVGSPPQMTLACESGTFRYLGRNLQTRTDENQQRFFPGDIFFQDLPGLIGRELPWHRSWVKTTPTGGGANSPRLFSGQTDEF